MSAALLQPGDRAPFCLGMSADNCFYAFDQQAGRAAAVIVAGDLSQHAMAAWIAAFARRANAFADAGGDVLLMTDPTAMQWVDAVLPAGVALVHCATPALFARSGVSAEPVVLVLDRAQTVTARLPADPSSDTPDGVAEAALAAVRALRGEPARTVAACAPVLMVPHLFDAACRSALIARFEGGDHAAGAMASIGAGGQAVSRIDEDKKRRRDCTLDPAEPIHGQVLDILSRRLVPEIKRAYQIDIAHIDRVLIARYDDTGGYFRRHRDNAAPQVAFRQFALSVNLNTEDYEGGELLFPEYTDHRYNPAAGAGIVFSASLLHEAAPVTRGSRYVLLTFLHDDAAESRRLQGIGRQTAAKAA